MLVVENSGHDSAEPLTRVAADTAREAGLALWSIDSAIINRAFGHPALTSKRQLRAVIRNIWPILNSRSVNQLVLDAAAAGLYAQTERLLAQHAGEPA